MKILYTLIILLVGAFIGYKIAQKAIVNKALAGNIDPIVNELNIQLNAIESKLKTETNTITIAKLTERKNQIMSLLSQFYGYILT